MRVAGASDSAAQPPAPERKGRLCDVVPLPPRPTEVVAQAEHRLVAREDDGSREGCVERERDANGRDPYPWRGTGLAVLKEGQKTVHLAVHYGARDAVHERTELLLVPVLDHVRDEP